MRSCMALLVLFGLVTGHSLTITAARATEPVDPFTAPELGNRGISTRISDEPEVEEKPGFSFPKLSLPKLPKPSLPKMSMPQFMKKEPSRDTGPSTWEKLSGGTKNAFSKTRDTLMPWAAKDEKPPARSVTGSRSSTGVSRTRVASNRNSREAPAEKKSFFSSWLPDSEPEENPIRTTSDFLSQKRPQFD